MYNWDEIRLLESEVICPTIGGHSGTVVTHLPPISEVSGSNPGSYVEKLVVNLDQLYVLVSSAHKTTLRNMTCTVLKLT